MERGERHLRRADEIEAVLRHLVEVALLRREEAGAVHRLLAHEHRRQHRHVPLRHDPRERPPVERDLEQRDVADAIDEPRARHARGALDVDPAVRRREIEVVARLERERRRIADHLDDDRVLLRRPVRRVLGRRGSERGRAAPAARSASPSRCFELLQLRLHARAAPRAAPASACPSASCARAARRPAARARARRRSAASSSSKRLRRALARERGAKRVGIVAGCAEVDHRVESRSASSTCATPSSDADGQTQSATAFTRVVRVLDGDPVAGPLDAARRRSRRHRTRSSPPA